MERNNLRPHLVMSMTDYAAQALKHFEINTELLRFRLLTGTSGHASIKRSVGSVELMLPYGFNFSDSDRQRWLILIIIRELRFQACHILPPRLDEFARQYNLRHQRTCIKNITSRWGSCSSLGNINLSLWLMLAPKELADYVILHELAHLNEMNHGPHFWAEVDRMTHNQGRALEREMKQFSLQTAVMFKVFNQITRGFQLK